MGFENVLPANLPEVQLWKEIHPHYRSQTSDFNFWRTWNLTYHDHWIFNYAHSFLGFKVSISLFSTGTLRNSNADYFTHLPNEHTSNNLIDEHEDFHKRQIQTEPGPIY